MISVSTDCASERAVLTAERVTPPDVVLRRHGLYCFGCSRSPFETIRLGAQKHGLTDHELERLVAELRHS